MQLIRPKCWYYKQQGIDGAPQISRKAFLPSYLTILCLRHQHTLQPQNSIPIHNEDKKTMHVHALTGEEAQSSLYPQLSFSRKFICTVEQFFWWKPCNLFCLPRQKRQHPLGRQGPEFQRSCYLATATWSGFGHPVKWALYNQFGHEDLDLRHLLLCSPCGWLIVYYPQPPQP